MTTAEQADLDGSMTHADALAWAESMVEPLKERAREAEQLRELPVATIADALDADIFKTVVPRELGGWGLGLRTLTDVPRILAHGCMSSASTLSFLMLHNWFIARGTKELQEDVFAARPFALISCPLAPTGKAVPTDGGYRLTGRWQWATGVQHGDWVMVNSVIEGNSVPPAMTFCTDSPPGRIHRDLVTLKGHVVYDWDRAAQLAGKLEAGLEPLPTDML